MNQDPPYMISYPATEKPILMRLAKGATAIDLSAEEVELLRNTLNEIVPAAEKSE